MGLRDRIANLFRNSDPAPSKPTGRRSNFFASIGNGGFQGAKVDRLTQDWQPGNAGPNTIHRADGGLLRDRSRDLAINNPFAKSAISAYVSNVNECGIFPKPLFEDAGIRKAWVDGWENYGAAEADITGMQSVYELASLWLEEVLVGGGCLAHFVELPPSLDRRIPLAVELIPEERFADDQDDYVLFHNRRKSGNQIFRGIEIDSRTGRPLRYWIRPTHPNDLGASFTEPIGIEAKDCHYAFFKKRIGQYRGVTMLYAAIMWLWKLGYYTDNELMASAIKSCFAAVITTDDDQDFNGLEDAGSESTDVWLNSLEKLSPGIVARLRKGEGVTGVGPNVPVGDALAWLIFIERAIGIAMDLSYEELIRDYSQGNFSSTRASANADRKRFKPMQQFAINHFYQPLYRRFAASASRAGIEGFPRPATLLGDLDNWLRVSWQAPGWMSVTPLDDARANEIELKNGTATHASIAASRGEDWEENYEQIDREEQLADKLELSFSAAVAEETMLAESQASAEAKAATQKTTKPTAKPTKGAKK